MSSLPCLNRKVLPDEWSNGFPLGNGEIGIMCWKSKGKLCLTLDHAGAWDLRHVDSEPNFGEYTYKKLLELADKGEFETIQHAGRRKHGKTPIGPTKVYLGRFEIDFDCVEGNDFSLSLEEALVTGKLQCQAGTCNLESFVCRKRDVVCLKVDQWLAKGNLKYIPFYETSPGLTALGHPEIKVSECNGLSVVSQQILPDTFFAICFNKTGPEIFISIAQGETEESAINKAVEDYPNIDFNALFEQHRQEWKEFWSVSAISIPEREIEFLWYYGLYIMASCIRKGSIPPGLQALWAMDGRIPPWRGDYHADMNVQEMFWSAGPANHLELLDVWIDYMYEMLPEVERITREIFETEGAFWFCGFLPEYTPLGCGGWAVVNFAWSNTGWLMSLVYSRWRLSMDKEWLLERGYPLVKSAFLFYANNLKMEEDGRYHIPLSDSPEYEEGNSTAWCKDPNVDIALIRKCCDWIVEMEQAVNINELTPRAKEIHEKLVPYHLVDFDMPGNVRVPSGTRILGLWKDKQLDQPHRHPSHLMAVHPAMDITIEGSEDERNLIDASLLQYLSLGQFCWAGHTYVQMVSFAAVIGRAEMAYNFLRQYCDNWVLPNGLHVNGTMGINGSSFFARPEEERSLDSLSKDLLTQGRDIQLTTNEICGISCGISDMLLQGWGDCIRIFPAVPDRWRDLMFIDLLTEGGFVVSALRRGGEVCWVRIKATVDRFCELRNPFNDVAFQSLGGIPEEKNNNLAWMMKKGQETMLFTEGNDKIDLETESKRIRDSFVNWLDVR